ncbi:MAG: tRNA (adenosine(37)-N6)-threonylcarbamoyltransferase complex dimerization subunit type 1 TsaB [Clostridiales bacterium GWF2_38_85]|nr:MAG: tRNA (adenosine(37)-N6)-threonylcarbamoyltransferase complex dimerization subunit type 1 TsaB [Clostridiales bacterium GWF2_38_85]HBL85266.1 tRNA (adenosine(37)-N6)-threonylcarbamoyltransferase complex dimerization subunit type 1 TsaB [Clostridiales bacterium]
MLILAFDTTAIVASCAVADINDSIVDKYAVFSIKNKLTHSENMMPMAEAMLKRYVCEMKDIDRIAVTVGPGSFTGVRIGVSTVKGLAMPYNIPCAAVSTLAALATNITPAGSIICPVMDARRSQFYNALFDGTGKRLCDDRIITADNLSEELNRFDKPIIICGDGARLFNIQYTGNANIILASQTAMYQNALSTAICGYYTPSIEAEKLQPKYLRPSQAERERNENNNKN